MRWLGLDLGSKTIGIACADPLGYTAQPLETWRRTGSRQADLDHLRHLVRVHDVGGILVGLPLDGDGRVGRQAKKTLEFVAQLRRALGLPVQTWDERFSTVAVERVLLAGDVSRRRRKQVGDKLAAAYVLQGFRDARCPVTLEPPEPEPPRAPAGKAG